MRSGFAHGTRRYVCSRWWSSLHSHLVLSIPGKRDKEELNPAGPRSVEKETLRLPHLVPTAIPITPGYKTFLKELLGIRSLSTLPCPAALWDLYQHCHYSINLTLWADKRQESIWGGRPLLPFIWQLTLIQIALVLGLFDQYQSLILPGWACILKRYISKGGFSYVMAEIQQTLWNCTRLYIHCTALTNDVYLPMQNTSSKIIGYCHKKHCRNLKNQVLQEKKKRLGVFYEKCSRKNPAFKKCEMFFGLTPQ